MKIKLLVALLLTIFWACKETAITPDPVVLWEPVTIEGQFVFNTYKVLGFNDNGLTQRWDKTEVRYWFDESNPKTAVIKGITDSVFTQINALSTSTKFIQTSDETKADITIYSGRSEDFEAKYKLDLGKELQVGGTAFTTFENAQGRIKKVVIWVTSIFPILDRKVIIRHEIGHAIGFQHVSTQKSIMWKTFDLEKYDVTDFAEIDQSYIKIHYNPKIKSGQTFAQVNAVLKENLK
jgi:Matrixin/Protein of unknown function (DUF2927)